MADQRNPQFKIRMPPEMREKLKASAEENYRSVNAEIIARLEETFGITSGESDGDGEGLKPCPFCGQELEEIRRRFNPYARCKTRDCMGGKMPVISLDVPEEIKRWNRRPEERK